MKRWTRIAAVSLVIICCTFAGGISLAAVDIQELDDLLTQVKTYDYGQSRENLTKITDMIREAGTSPDVLKQIEKRLDDFVCSDATYAAKQFACKQLSLIGTADSVPALAPMLTDEKYSDMARYALERIPGSAVDEALRSALVRATGKAKAGIINTLAVRGDTKAVPEIAKLIDDSDKMIAGAAAAALGRIGSVAATETLAKAMGKTSGALRGQVLDAYLKCADRLAAGGKKSQAFAIYQKLYTQEKVMPIKAAALRGMVTTAENPTETVVGALKASDQPMQTVAIGLLRDVADTEMIKAVAGMFDDLSVTSRVQLLSALADCGDKAALDSVVGETKSSDVAVRVAALSALAKLGDASTVDLLVSAAAKTTGDEQQAAQQSLYRLRGADIDRAILQKIPGADASAKVELIRSLDQRNTAGSVPGLLKTISDSDSKVRIESIKAFRTVVQPKDLPALIDILVRTGSSSERGEMEKTIVAVARKITDQQEQANAVLAALPSVKDVPARSSLLSVLGKIGVDSAMPVLREALKDSDPKIKDAAVRALSEWPTPEPAAELLNVAQTSQNQVHKVLALRGYVRLIGLESDRPDEETIKMYKTAMDLAPNANEKRTVLSGLSNTRSWEGMQMAAAYLDDEDLKAEAEAAVVKIARGTAEDHPEETKELLKKVLETTKSESVRQQAKRMLGFMERN